VGSRKGKKERKTRKREKEKWKGRDKRYQKSMRKIGHSMMTDLISLLLLLTYAVSWVQHGSDNSRLLTSSQYGRASCEL